MRNRDGLERERERQKERERESQVYRLLVVLIAVVLLLPYDVQRQIVLRYYISGAQSNFYCATLATTNVSLIITVTTTQQKREAVTATITV